MPIGMAWMWDIMQRRFARFAIEKTLGQFLRYKVDPDQVAVDASGAFTLSQVELNSTALDKYLLGTPLQVVHGYIRSVSGSVPFARLLTEGCEVTIEGIELVLRPRKPEEQASQTAVDPAASMMTVIDELGGAVEELGENLAREVAAPEFGDKRPAVDGVEALTYAAKRVISQVHIVIKDVDIRVVVPQDDAAGEAGAGDDDGNCVCLYFHLGRAELRDTTGTYVSSTGAGLDVTGSSHSVKELQISDYGLYLEYAKQPKLEESFYLRVEQRIPLIKFIAPDGATDVITIKLQHAFVDHLPKVDINVFVYGMFAALSPSIVKDLSSLIQIFQAAASSSTSGSAGSDAESNASSEMVSAESAEDNWNKSWRISSKLLRSAILLAYEDGKCGEDGKSLTFYTDVARVLADRSNFTYKLSESPLFQLVRQPHLHLGLDLIQVGLGSGQSPLTVQVRDLGVYECEFPGNQPAIYDLLVTAACRGELDPSSSSEEQNDEPLEALNITLVKKPKQRSPPPDVAGGDAKVKTPSAPNLAISLRFLRGLELAADLSVVDRLYGYMRVLTPASKKTAADTGRPAPSTTNATSGSAAASGDAAAPADATAPSSTQKPSTALIVSINLPRLTLRLPVPLAPVLQTDRSRAEHGWLRRPEYRPATVLVRLDDALLRLLLGPTMTETTRWNCNCQTELQVQTKRIRLSLQPPRPAPPLLLLSLDGAGASAPCEISLRLQQPPRDVGDWQWPVREVDTLASSFSIARQDQNLSPTEFASWLYDCACKSEVNINIEADTLIGDLPRAPTEQFVQLLLELGEWMPWSILHQRAMAEAGSHSSSGDAAAVAANAGAATGAAAAGRSSARTEQTAPSLTASQLASTLESDTLPSHDVRRNTGGTREIRPHIAAVTVRCRRASLKMHEAAAAEGIASTTYFTLALDQAIIAVVHGLGGSSGHRALVMRGRRSALHQTDPTLELAPPPHQHHTRVILDVDASLLTSPVAAKLAAATTTGSGAGRASLEAADSFVVAMLTRPASELTLNRTSFVLDFSSLCIRHFEDPRGHWLTRSLKLVSFADPADWPKAADRPISILGLTVHFADCGALVEPIYKPLAGKLLLPQLHITSNISSATPLTRVDVHIDQAQLLLIDDRVKLRLQEDHWTTQGWRSVVSAEDLHLTLTFSDRPSDISLDVDITDRNLVVTTCADSFVTLIGFANALVSDKPSKRGDGRGEDGDITPAEPPLGTLNSAAGLSMQDGQEVEVRRSFSGPDTAGSAYRSSAYTAASHATASAASTAGPLSLQARRSRAGDSLNVSSRVQPASSESPRLTAAALQELQRHHLEHRDDSDLVPRGSPALQRHFNSERGNSTTATSMGTGVLPSGASGQRRKGGRLSENQSVAALPAAGSVTKDHEKDSERDDEEEDDDDDEAFASADEGDMEESMHQPFRRTSASEAGLDEPSSSAHESPEHLETGADRVAADIDIEASVYLESSQELPSQDLRPASPPLVAAAHTAGSAEHTPTSASPIDPLQRSATSLRADMEEAMRAQVVREGSPSKFTAGAAGPAVAATASFAARLSFDEEYFAPREAAGTRAEAGGAATEVDPDADIFASLTAVDVRQRPRLGSVGEAGHDLFAEELASSLAESQVSDANADAAAAVAAAATATERAPSSAQAYGRGAEAPRPASASSATRDNPRATPALSEAESTSTAFTAPVGMVGTVSYLRQPNKAVPVYHDYLQEPSTRLDDFLKAPDFLPKVPKQRFRLRRMSVVWNMISGRDWRLPTDDDESGGQTGPRRNNHCGVSISLGDLNVVREAYAAGQPYKSRVLLLLKRFDVQDNVPASFMQTLVSEYLPDGVPIERDSHMLRLQMMDVLTPDAQGVGEPETIIQVRMRPLRINLDQDTLNFLIGFFTYVPGTSETGIEQGWEELVYPPADEAAEQKRRQELAQALLANAPAANGQVPDVAPLASALGQLMSAQRQGGGEAAAAQLVQQAMGQVIAAVQRRGPPSSVAATESLGSDRAADIEVDSQVRSSPAKFSAADSSASRTASRATVGRSESGASYADDSASRVDRSLSVVSGEDFDGMMWAAPPEPTATTAASAGLSAGGSRATRSAVGNEEEEEEEEEDEETESEVTAAGSDGNLTPSLSGQPPPEAGGHETYFKLVDMGQLIFCIDFEPKRLSFNDLVAGDLTELTGLISLKKAHVVLMPAMVKGVSGWGKLAAELQNEWRRSLTRSQIFSLALAGIPGGTSVSNIVSASAQIFHQPVQQYPYVLHGVRDGVYQGVVVTATEMCNIGTTLLIGVQAALELAQGLTPSGADDQRSGHAPQRSRLSRQPQGILDGMYLGYRALVDAVRRSYHHVAVRPLEHSGGSVTPSVLVRMVGAVPGAGLQPIIGMCEAAALSLQGLRNALRPEERQELEQKYKPYVP